jgi:hypothetical protein
MWRYSTPDGLSLAQQALTSYIGVTIFLRRKTAAPVLTAYQAEAAPVLTAYQAEAAPVLTAHQ